MSKFNELIINGLMYLIMILIIAFPIFSLYTIMVWGPVALYTEVKCLEAGYPEYKVTVGLQKYCLNLEGTVSVQVNKL